MEELESKAGKFGYTGSGQDPVVAMTEVSSGGEIERGFDISRTGNYR